MKIFTILLVIFCAVSATLAGINISGVVTDISGVPISGALVMLEKSGLSTTTETLGQFTITDSPVGGITGSSCAAKQLFSAIIRNSILTIDLAQKSSVRICGFTVNGQLKSSIIQQLQAGSHKFVLSQSASGIIIYKIAIDKKSFILKSIQSGCSHQGFVSRFSQSNSALTPAKLAKSAAVIDDVLKVTKDGYLDYHVAITNPDTSEITLKMIVSSGTLIDVDGNEYQTVRLGDQEWIVENLRTTKYNDGTPIPLDTSNATWANATTDKYCFYNNTTNIDSIKKLGALYNFYVVKSGKLAPSGWAVPSFADWDSLETYLAANGYSYLSVGKSIAAQTDWLPSTAEGTIGNNIASNNNSGLSILPCGIRDHDDGKYILIDSLETLWGNYESTQTQTGGCFYILNTMSAAYPTSTVYSMGLGVRVMRKFIPVGIPQITVQPSSNPLVTVGQSIILSVTAAGNPTPSYKWQKNGIDIPNAKFATLTFASAEVSNSGTYTVIVKNSQGADTSSPSFLSVIESGTMTDYEGNVYQTVKIGTKQWMAENLRSTKYNDGSTIPLDTVTANWSNAATNTDKFCYYNNNSNADSIRIYGALYNWYTVKTGKLAPSGWHVPTSADWDDLQTFLIAHGSNWDAATSGNKIAKALAARSNWNTSTIAGAIGNDLTKNNSTGFSALPAGNRTGSFGSFSNHGFQGFWWTSTEHDALTSQFCWLSYRDSSLLRDSFEKRGGCSVRLVKD